MNLPFIKLCYGDVKKRKKAVEVGTETLGRMTVSATGRVTWLLVVYIAHLTTLPVFTVGALDFSCPRECNCYTHVPGLPQHMIVYRCTITSIEPTTNFSVMNTGRVSGLVLDCVASTGSELADNLFISLSSFVAVTIKNCHFTYIPRHAFSGMSGLQDLKIYNAKNLRIHEHAFLNIPQLQNLAIISSGVQNLPNLCNVPNLMSLNLTDNSIEEFQDAGLNCSGLASLQRLTHIDLTDNDILQLQKFVSKSVPNLTHLMLSNNKLDQNGYNMFGDFPHLQWLDLNRNAYSSFPVDMLAKCSNLNVLGLAENKVQNLPRGFFSSISNLQLLEFDHSGVEDYIWTEVNRLKQLKILHLEHNNIQSFGLAPPDLENLMELNLYSNSVMHLNPYVFSKMTNLQKLKLAHNKLTAINENDFAGLENLADLYLQGNSINYFHAISLSQLNSLRILNISYNNIENLPVFNNLPELFVVDARNNVINNITTSLCDGSGIAGINLMRNKISYLSSYMFQRCYSLQFLHLAYNQISSIEFGSFKDTIMSVLILHNNKISDITNLMTGMKLLTEVDLSNNEIQGAIYSDLFPSTIQSLDLSFNEITSIASYTFTKMTDLRKVDLRMNKISTFSSYAISVSTQTIPPPVFYINGNRLNCDCNLYWLKKMNESTRISPGTPVINDIDTTWCGWAYQRTFVLMYKVPIEDFLCDYREKCGFPCPCCEYHHCDCRQSCPESCDCYRSQDWSSRHYVLCDSRHLTSVPQPLPNLATKVHLDGNNITIVGSHEFIGMSDVKILFLNHSRIVKLQTRSFVGLKALKSLHLDHNQISQLQSDMFSGLGNVTILHLEYNAISWINNSTFEYLTSLSALYLYHNHLNILQENVISTTRFRALSSLTLSGNPWSCHCDDLVPLGNYLYETASNVTDIKQLECVNNVTGDSVHLSKNYFREYRTCLNITDYFNITVQEVKERENKDAVVSLTVICVFVVVAVVVTGLAAWHRELLKIWIFTKFGIRLLSTKLDDKGKLYDAFVSYSSKDEHIVLNEIVPRLENGVPRYRLCLHFRDFPVGAPIGDNIVDSIEASKRTIMLLSNNFLSSEWCQFEFQTAHHHVLRERLNRLIIVLLDDLDQDKVEKDPQLKLYLKTRTYLKFDDPWFWEKLKFAMPEVKDNEVDEQDPVERNSYLGPINPYAVVNVVDTTYEEPISSNGSNSVPQNLALNSAETDKMEVVSVQSVDSSNIYEEIYPV